ncbi:MAG: nuclease domain-containing protein [Bacillaceae bacterium]
MALPFNLLFKQFDKIIAVGHCWMTEREVEYLNEEKIPYITENMDLDICFQSEEKDARLYMEGLDSLPSKETESDEDGVFIRPTNGYLSIFNSKKAETHSPFIPGLYLLKIVCGSTMYYSGLRIKTKQMTTEEWEMMKNEIEEKIPGFVYNNERKSGFLKKNSLKLELIDKRWYRIFEEIISAPNYTICSKQQVYMNRKRGIHKRVHDKEIMYHTLENQWLKIMIHYLIDVMNRWMIDGDTRQELKQMRTFLVLLLHQTWLKDIQMHALHVIPPAFLMDYRYKAVYELYRYAKSEEGQKRDFGVKRTDLLYETWCYLQLIHSLTSEELGFKIKNEWNHSYMQDLESMGEGTTVVFTKEAVTLQLVYDQVIPYESSQTSLTCPVYTSGQNNRPDTRMDIYYDEIYCGSIIIDYKYRPLKHIWDFALLRTRKPNRVMMQLDNYKSQVRSHLIGGGKQQYRRMNPIVEVWAIFPKGNIGQWTGNPLEEYGIRFIELKPNGQFTYLKESLKEAINETIDLFVNVSI